MSRGISLLELAGTVKNAVGEAFQESYWVIAEISEISVNRNGHCYLELIEKNNDSGQTIARMRATIWAGTFRILKPYFESATGHIFTSGIKVLIFTSVEFHEQFGLSLNITDIEPSFTIGDVERQRRQIIQRLMTEGVIDMNKELLLPEAPQRIAVISSIGAAGYDDFVHQISNNIYGFKFYLKLFNSVMQGAETELSVIKALERIYYNAEHFDAVVIIRGGGAKADLASFDSYEIANNIAQFPMPVITGIGHERDDTIADLVCHTRCKTPTAVAEFLVDHLLIAEQRINSFAETIFEAFAEASGVNHDMLIEYCERLDAMFNERKNIKVDELKNYLYLLHAASVESLRIDNRNLLSLQKDLSSNSMKSAVLMKNEISKLASKIKFQLKLETEKTRSKLSGLESQCNFLNPENILQMGYTRTYVNGRPVFSSKGVEVGDKLSTVFFDGKVAGIVIKNEN